MIHLIWKPVGLTPLNAVEALKRKLSLSGEDARLAYAGRLDPMAEGVLPLLGGEDRFSPEKHRQHDKTYISTFVVGLQSDSGDLLGLVKVRDTITQPDLPSLVGNRERRLPDWASPHMKNQLKGLPITPLFKHMDVHSVDLLGGAYQTGEELKQYAFRQLEKATFPYRVAEARRAWEALPGGALFQTHRVQFQVAAGTYIRTLAEESGCLVLSLTRTRVGDWGANDCVII